MPAPIPDATATTTAQPTSVIPAAISSGCGVELIELLLARGADPVGRGPDGRSPYQLAIAQGRGDLAAAVLRDHTGES